MTIDIPTILLLMTFISGTVGVIFLTTWMGSRGTDLELRMACVMLPITAGAALIVMRGRIGDWISIDMANALIALGLGFSWSLARSFRGMPAPIGVVVAGAVIWLVACQVPTLHDTVAYRIALSSLIAAIYSGSAGVEFLRRSQEPSRWREMVGVVCIAHAVFTVGRGAFWLLGFGSANPLEGNWVQAVLLIEPLIAVTTFAVLGMALFRGRTEHILRQDAETDPLTGILNRRALMSRAEFVLDEGRRNGQPVTLLVFDLDHFKAINDRFGHPVGDRTLCAFTQVVASTVRANDLFGRIGGEEFAAVLVGADARVGQRIAERIRMEFSMSTVIDGVEVPASVSAGVAEAPPGMKVQLDDLFAEADVALYEAKRSGRDRVVSALALAS